MAEKILEGNIESGEDTDESYDETIFSPDEVDGSHASKPKKSKKKLKYATFECPPVLLCENPRDEIYNMNPKKMGKCIIFNHEVFICGMRERKGTDKDAEELKRFFGKLQFDVKVYKDKKADEVLQILSEVQAEDHKDSSCFVCCVLTHGNFDRSAKEEIIYAKDKSYATDKLFIPFSGDKCPSLVGKPKLFFIQACRGGKVDDGVLNFYKYLRIQPMLFQKKTGILNIFKNDGVVFNLFNYFFYQSMFARKEYKISDIVENESAVAFKIPTYSDFLIACSTVPGSIAFKGLDEGSWYMQTLCETLWRRSNNLDLLSMLTIVCREVAYCYESNCLDPLDDQKKQVPSIYSTLTRQVRFPPINDNEH